MHSIAPSENAAVGATLESYPWDNADRFHANPGRKAHEYFHPVRSIIFLCSAGVSRCARALVVVVLCGLSGCSTSKTQPLASSTFQSETTTVIQGAPPRAVQPNLALWRRLKVGMTEGEVTALLGPPQRKDPRPPADTEPNVRHLYGWCYGEISFASFTTSALFDYTVSFHEGVVFEIRDPWNGRFSPDGRPTVPELVLPEAGKTLHHYPRFLDFRWQPSSGVYPIEYEIEIQSLSVSQQEAAHFEDYIRQTVELNRSQWKKDGLSQPDMEEAATSLARDLRKDQGAMQTFRFRTHDLYVPFTWVGANTGRWRVRAANALGASDWTGWRFFTFTN